MKRIVKIEFHVFWNDWTWNLGKPYHTLRFIEIGPVLIVVEYA